VRVVLGVPLVLATIFHVGGTLIAGPIWVVARVRRLSLPAMQLIDPPLAGL
jgi:hypothetical protein